MPYHEPKTHKTYSMGTRFVGCPVQEDPGSKSVYLFDPKIKGFRIGKIPNTYLIQLKAKTPSGKIKNFVNLLKSWCYLKEGFIPYVLGGMSWTTPCQVDAFTAKLSGTKNETYHRADWKEPTKHGLDCMGVVGRAAQICEIPFFIKNTTTLPKKLRPLKPQEPLIEGDLLYWQWGHVMVISDIEAGLLIESRGYDQGYGRVQEIHVSKVFQDIENFDDLKKAFFHKKPLKLLHKNGSVFRTLKEYKILKIQSVWDTSAN